MSLFIFSFLSYRFFLSFFLFFLLGMRVGKIWKLNCATVSCHHSRPEGVLQNICHERKTQPFIFLTMMVCRRPEVYFTYFSQLNSSIARYSLLHQAAARPISCSFIIYLFCHPLSIAFNLYNWRNVVKFQWVRFLLTLIQAGESEACPVK